MQENLENAVINGYLPQRAVAVGAAALIALASIGQQYNSEWCKNLVKPKWMASITVTIIMTIIMYVIYIWCWYKSIQSVKYDNRSQVDLIFSIGLLLQLVWVLTFFTIQNVSSAKYVMLISTLFTIFQIWYMSKITMGWSCSLLFGAYLLWNCYSTATNFSVADNTPRTKSGYDVDRMILRSNRPKKETSE